MTNWIVLALGLTSILALYPQSTDASLAYQRPSTQLEALATAELAPRVLADSSGKVLLLLSQHRYPSIQDLSEPELRLAGVRVNPQKYALYTTKPSTEKLKKLTYASNEKLKGYKETHSNMRFNRKTGKWVKNTSNSYVKDEYKYRYNSNNNKKLNVPTKLELYGFKESRDKHIPKALFENSAVLPYVGLKK